MVVLGHTQCGVVTVTLDELQGRATSQSKNLRSIVNRVRPPLEKVLASGSEDGAEALLHAAVRANVRASADHLRHGSKLLEQLIHDDGLVVVGAEYSLETGIVGLLRRSSRRRLEQKIKPGGYRRASSERNV